MADKLIRSTMVRMIGSATEGAGTPLGNIIHAAFGSISSNGIQAPELMVKETFPKEVVIKSSIHFE